MNGSQLGVDSKSERYMGTMEGGKVHRVTWNQLMVQVYQPLQPCDSFVPDRLDPEDDLRCMSALQIWEHGHLGIRGTSASDYHPR
jgi:hypothetical protein